MGQTCVFSRPRSWHVAGLAWSRFWEVIRILGFDLPAKARLNCFKVNALFVERLLKGLRLRLPQFVHGGRAVALALQDTDKLDTQSLADVFDNQDVKPGCDVLIECRVSARGSGNCLAAVLEQGL